MTDRTVRVNLTAAVAGFVGNMDRAAAATRQLSKVTTEAKLKAERHAEAMGKVGVAFLAGGAVAAAGLALVIKATTEYGAKMAQLQSLSHASAEEMKQLSDAAMSQGQAFGFSATQVADAEIELTKAGVGVKDQLGGALKGALALAAAGQIDVGQATEYATVAMTQFGLSAGDVPHLADLMAAGADKALGSVGDLGEALKNGGLQAHNMGLTLDDTVGLLSAFANAGILGAEAGTQMRSMFIQLQKPTKQSQAVLDKYGISLNDASGKFVGITALAGELHDKLGGLTQAQRNAALATIFGSHAITGATVLYQDGAKGISGWIKAVNDTGFASAQAAGKMNSLQGDVQKLAAIFQTDLIKAGTGAQGSLRGIVQSATGLLKVFGDLPAPIQGAIVPLGLVVAGIGLIGGTALIAVPKIVAFKAAMAEAELSGKSLAGKIGKGSALLIGLTAVAAGMAAAAQMGTASAQQIEQAGLSIQNGWKGVDKLFASSSSSINSAKGLKASLDELGNGGDWFQSGSGTAKQFDAMVGGLTHFADVYKTNEATFDAMGQQLAGLAKINYKSAASSFAGLTKQYHLNADQQKNLLRVMPAYRDEIVAQLGKVHIAATAQNILNGAMGRGRVGAKLAAQAQKEAAAAAQKNATQLAKLTGSGNDATQSMKDLYDALNNLGSTELDARSAARKFQQAIDDATKAVKDNGKGLDINTQKGRDNQAALDDIAQSAAASAAAYVQNGGSAAGAAKRIADGRSAYIHAAEAMGLSKDQANRLADSLHLIPKNINIAAKATGFSDAERQADILSGKMNNLDGTRATIYVDVAGSAAGAAGRAGQITRNAFQADGGMWQDGHQLATTHAANGLVRDSMIVKGGANITWAEPETGWEAYISGKSGASARNKAIWAEAGRRLGTLQSAGSSPKTYSGAGSSYGGSAGGTLNGNLYLDSGEWLGKVRGEVSTGISQYHLNQQRRMPRA